ncbi:MAG: aminotransferase class I/II-fold pyridoxal phosphate-dependent enzyme [Clostridiales bacterium]|nr:aminotransferase class I/II-fold pyridoxal phosphate-dependent enzyme [Clostridiales bacterium]
MDYSKHINETMQAIKPSGIRRFFDIVSEMEDVISLGIGEPDFQTPADIRSAGMTSLKIGQTKYTSNAGLVELRQEVENYYRNQFNVDYSDIDECLITVGASEAIDLCFRALLNPGDEVLIPEPNFVCYAPLTEMSGCKPVPIVTTVEHKFKLTPEALKAAITPKTKMLVFPYPNNPTGAIMDRNDLEKIAEILRGTDILVVTDEIYGEFTYSGKHVSMAEIEGMKEQTVVISGFSKAFAMTGWRLGYALGPKPLIAAMTKLHQFGIMSAPTTAQYAGLVAMTEGFDSVQAMKKEYNKRRKLIVKGFNDMGLTCFEPEGAFYCFPCIKSTGLTSDEFSNQLLKAKKVAVIPGDAFGECGEGFVRVSYCYSTEHIQVALDRIKEFIDELK